MAQITTTQLGNGTGAYSTDIVVKDLDMNVSNLVKESTPVLSMAMAKKRKVNSTLPLWTNDVFRAPATQAHIEGDTVASSSAPSNTRANLGNYTQIFSTVISATGTAQAVDQAGGDPMSYQQIKQLTELMFDVEAQIVRDDQIGTKYAGQAGSAGGLTGAAQTGRRMGSLNSFAGTHSFNTTSGNASTISTHTNNDSTDSAAENEGNLVISANGSQYYTASDFANQKFAPTLYKQLVSAAEARFNAKIRSVVVPTSLRTHISDTMPTSRSINRVGYTYQIYDSWIMDSVGANDVIYFLNEDVLQWGSLRDLGPNNDIASNADASLEHFVMEGTLIVRNPAGVGVLHNISTSGADVSATRPAALVARLSTWNSVAF